MGLSWVSVWRSTFPTKAESISGRDNNSLFWTMVSFDENTSVENYKASIGLLLSQKSHLIENKLPFYMITKQEISIELPRKKVHS